MVTCDECGTANRDDAQFCTQCDAYLAWAGPAAKDTASEPAQGDTDPVRADAAPLRPQTPTPSRPANATPRRPEPEQPAPEQRQPVARATDPRTPSPPGDQLGAVRPAERKAKVRKQYAPSTPRRDVAGWPPADPTAALDLPPAADPRSLRGSLVGARVARGFNRQMRAAAGGRRVRYDRGLTGRVLAVRTVLGALALLLVLVMLIGPWRTSVRSFADRQLDRVIPGRFQDVEVAAVSVEPPGTEEIRGFLPSYAVDKLPTRAWATRVTAPAGADPGAQCAADGNQPELVARFAAPTQIDRVTIQAGLDPGSPDRLKQARPRTVDMAFSDGQCVRQQLLDVFDPVNIAVPAAQAESVRIRIVDVYPPRSGQGDLAAISEVTFSQR
jgi:hypothetical protein